MSAQERNLPIENGPDLSRVAVALGQAARLGGRRLLAHHTEGSDKLQTRYKGDGTPVTIADEQSEHIINKMVKRYLPTARIYGEEGGISGNLDSSTTVYIDPLDGTNPYTHGEVVSTVGIAIRENNMTTVSAICLPFERKLLVAEKGKGTWMWDLDEELAVAHDSQGKALAPQRMRTSSHAALNGSVIFVDANFFPANAGAKVQFLDNLSQQIQQGQNISLRMISSNINQESQVARGIGEATVCDCVGGPYDLFAGELAIQEAGGIFTDIQGNPVTEQTQVALSSANETIHNKLLSTLQSPYQGYRGFRR